MAKYRAKPVIVDAFKILSIGLTDINEDRLVALDNGTNALATDEMRARIAVQPGDYWVVQSDGYVDLNPKDVFERKYEAAE